MHTYPLQTSRNVLENKMLVAIVTNPPPPHLPIASVSSFDIQNYFITFIHN